MNRYLFFVAALLLSGCVTSRIEQSRDAVTGIASGEAMVLLGRASYNEKQTEESFTDCIAEALEIPVEAEQPPAALDRHSGQVGIHPQFWGRTLMIRELQPEVAHLCRLIGHQNSGMGQQDLQ